MILFIIGLMIQEDVMIQTLRNIQNYSINPISMYIIHMLLNVKEYQIIFIDLVIIKKLLTLNLKEKVQ